MLRSTVCCSVRETRFQVPPRGHIKAGVGIVYLEIEVGVMSIYKYSTRTSLSCCRSRRSCCMLLCCGAVCSDHLAAVTVASKLDVGVRAQTGMASRCCFRMCRNWTASWRRTAKCEMSSRSRRMWVLYV